MARAIALRPEFTGTQLRALARQSKDSSQARRLLTFAVLHDGDTRSEAALLGDVTLQIVRDRVLRFNTEGPAGLIDRKPPGQPRLLTEVHRQALMAMIESGPRPALHGVMRRRLCDLGQWLWEEFRVSVSKQTLRRELRAIGRQKLSARPKHHTQAPDAIEAFTTFPAALARIAADQGIGLDAIDLWFQDEVRIGQKNKITRRWARRGTRASAPQDQRTASNYIYGTVCQRMGKGAAEV